MKRMIAILLATMLLVAVAAHGESYSIERDNIVNFQALLNDMLAVYEDPSVTDARAIGEDVDVIRGVSPADGEIAATIAECWEKVYLDPDYPLYLYTGNGHADDLAQTAISDSADHAFIVLGYELKDGEMTEELMGRCEAAAAAAKNYPKAILVCSGGATGENNPMQHTEAGLMKGYLVDRCGIAPERIIIDENAMNTVENAVNTFDILRENGIRTMTIITSAYHQRRGQVIYNAVAALYRQSNGFFPVSVANYCLDIEPANDRLRNDAPIAVRQLGAILGLPDEHRHP